MLETYLDLKNETTSRLNAIASSTFFTPTKIGEWVNQAYIWAATLYKWPALERARITKTFANHDYYDYPPDFQTDSLTRLIVDGKKYDKKDFNDFLDYREANPTSTKRIFSDYGRQYFIFPTPTADGDKNIEVWGIIIPARLVNATDKTFFTKSETMGNEAIVKKALSIGLAKGKDKKTGQAEEMEAGAILTTIYSKIAQRQQEYQRLDHPRFEVPDYFKR